MKSWKTSLIGAILIVAAICFFATSKVAEGGLCLTAGVGFLSSKDHNQVDN